ncbi:MAG: hypothetical protein RJA22_2236 [Verrucomicrobiota bacterium]
MKPKNILLLLSLSASLATLPPLGAAEPKPLQVLLITGGCCHDYAQQKDLLKKGLEERAHVVVTQVHTNDRSTKARFALYENADWAKGYDVVIHDECSADVKDLPFVQNILAAHKGGVGAVNLHCAMHSYRTGTPDWFEFIGLQSTGHGPQEPIAISFVESPGHPTTRGLANWTTIKEELYNNVKVFPGAQPLARGKQVVKRKDGTEKTDEAVVAWANQYGQGRVWSTTIGHNNGTVGDSRYLDLVTRGVLWTAGKLSDDGKPLPGYAAQAK